MSPSGFEPRILGFLCNWCSYAGADLAGVSRFQYPPSLRAIRVMCSARVDPEIVLEAFVRSIDGVMVLGCHLGDCHYIIGNYYTKYRMETVKRLLGKIGLKPERLMLDWVSAAEGERFATLVKNFTETIKRLGPLGEIEGLEKSELKAKLVAARDTLAQQRFRWLVGKERELVEYGNVFGEKIPLEDFENLLLEILEAEVTRNRIMLMLKETPSSVEEIARRLRLSPREVLNHIVALEGKGLISMVGIEEDIPKYHKR